MPTPAEEIERYLQTGDYDPVGSAWQNGNLLESFRKADKDLHKALISEVKRREPRNCTRPIPHFDLVAFTRTKVEPMVRGLFPKIEQELVLQTLERSVVFLTPENIESVLSNEGWLHTAWDLANLYLLSIDAEPLGEDAIARIST